MPYSYYRRLRASDKKIYRASDKIENINLKNSEALFPYVEAIQSALQSKQKNCCSKDKSSACESINLAVRNLADKNKSSYE